jgi:hypothetical protein
LRNCLYLVGSPEDELWLRLWLSLVPGWTHPCSSGDRHPHRLFLVAVPAAGRRGGRHLRSFGVEGHLSHQVLILGVAPGYGESPGRLHSRPSYAWNWGPQELTYSYVPAASMQDESSRHGGDGGKANSCNFRRRRSSLLPVSPLAVAVNSQQPNSMFHKQCTFMLSYLEMVGPRQQPLIAHFTAAITVVEHQSSFLPGQQWQWQQTIATGRWQWRSSFDCEATFRVGAAESVVPVRNWILNYVIFMFSYYSAIFILIIP